MTTPLPSTTQSPRPGKLAERLMAPARLIFAYDCKNCGASCVGMAHDPRHVHEGFCSEQCVLAPRHTARLQENMK